MLIEIKVWDHDTSSQTMVMLNPSDFGKCQRNPMGIHSYILTTHNGDKYILLGSEVDYLEKLGYIKRR